VPYLQSYLDHTPRPVLAAFEVAYRMDSPDDIDGRSRGRHDEWSYPGPTQPAGPNVLRTSLGFGKDLLLNSIWCLGVSAVAKWDELMCLVARNAVR
jgi:hypothetical protein